MSIEKKHNEKTGHISVLTQEVLHYLNVQEGKTYIDATFGAGGHTKAILEQNKTCKVISFDWDAQSIESYEPPLKQEFGDRIKVLWGNFGDLYRILKKNNIGKVDGILADFGTSQMQIFDRDGFSFQKDTPLDMRMSPAHQHVTAAHIINTSSEEKLKQMFYQLGGEQYAKSIVRAIIERRKRKPFEMTVDLATVIAGVVPKKKGVKIHPATKVFQALRIYVNRELENLHSFLIAASRMLKPGGRLVCISFHSLEDRPVKTFFRELEQLGKAKLLTRSAVTATDEEVAANPSSRSARLRAIEVVE